MFAMQKAMILHVQEHVGNILVANKDIAVGTTTLIVAYVTLSNNY